MLSSVSPSLKIAISFNNDNKHEQKQIQSPCETASASTKLLEVTLQRIAGRAELVG